MKMLLAGQWVDREKTIDVRDPFDDSLIDTVPAATADDVETALAAADAARGVARAMSTYERSQILLKTASIVADNLEDFAVTIAREGSKTIREARGEAKRCINTLTISGEEAKRLLGETIPFDSFPGGEQRRGHFERVRMVSFTGGVEAGERIVAKAGLKKIGMELGSNSPVIVWHDADIEWAAETCVSGAFWAAGQNCIGVQRVYIHRNVYDEFRELFVERTKRYTIGDKMNETTDMGPMINEGEARRVERWVAEAVEKGATVLAGGSRDRALMEPTVLENVPVDATIHHEEVFGPAVNLYPVDDLEQAISEANSVDYGLHAAAFSRDVETCHRLIQGLDAGSVLINDSTDYRLDSMPFGGVKKSGLGREGIRFSLAEMTEPKVVCWYLPGV